MLNTIKKNYEFYKKKYYRGNDIFCPFCSGFYKAQKHKFSKETGTECPVCGSEIDERTILLFLQTKTDMMSGENKILIIAEEGRITDYFKNFPNTEVKIYTETGDFSIRDNTLKNKYDDDEFDIIVCNYILEKLPEHKSVLKELKRILKPEGLLMLQAHIDPEKDKTVEMPLTYYKDRFLMYGIAGNYRRFGQDYPDFIKSFGLNLSRLKFSSGFEKLPENSLKKDEVIYLAHKTDRPILSDNMDVLEEGIDIQKSKSRSGSISALIYTVFFIFPEIFKKYMLSLLGNLSERQDNKNKFIYMIYNLLIGLTLFWGTLAFFKATSGFESPFMTIIHLFIGWPVFIIGGFGGLSILTGYVFLNDHAGFIKKSIVAFFLFLSLFLSLRAGLM